MSVALVVLNSVANHFRFDYLNYENVLALCCYRFFGHESSSVRVLKSFRLVFCLFDRCDTIEKVSKVRIGYLARETFSSCLLSRNRDSSE